MSSREPAGAHLPHPHRARVSGAPCCASRHVRSHPREEPHIMHIVITGATGNVGTSVIESLATDTEVISILGLARRMPTWQAAKTTWAQADVAQDDLVPHLRGADALIHLAWLFQPTHDPVLTWRSNVEGSVRVFRRGRRGGRAHDCV